MERKIVLKAENDRRTALSSKRKELRDAFNFSTGDFGGLIESLTNE
jgi:hypothetical protein